MLLDARNLSKAFGAFRALDGASIAVEEGEVLGLIGPNGAGKSNFFNCLTGDPSPSSGSVHFQGQDVTALGPDARARLGIARTFQVPLTFESMSVLDNVMIGRLPQISRPRGGPSQGAPSHRSCRARRRARRCCKEPRHTRPQAAGDRPRAGFRAQGAAAR